MLLSKVERERIDYQQSVRAAPPHSANQLSLYDLVRDYPYRTVSTNTAYVRMLRHQNPAKLHDACTRPVMYQGRSNALVSSTQNPFFWMALQGKQSSRRLADQWGIHFTTVNKYRRDIREGILAPEPLKFLHTQPSTFAPFLPMVHTPWYPPML